MFFKQNYLGLTYEQIRNSIVASIPACHAGDPGSIPGFGAFCYFESENILIKTLFFNQQLYKYIFRVQK